MNKNLSDKTAPLDGATVVITHKLRENVQDEYERWIEKIEPLGRASSGYLDSNIIRPIPGLTETYTVIIRFDSEKNLRNWMKSPVRARLIEEVRPFLATDDDFYINSGLDFLFSQTGAKAKVPVRWKQYLVTWSVIYPLSLSMPFLINPVLHQIGVPNNRPITSLVITGIIVFLMVYVIMPRYTRLVRRWLYH